MPLGCLVVSCITVQKTGNPAGPKRGPGISSAYVGIVLIISIATLGKSFLYSFKMDILQTGCSRGWEGPVTAIVTAELATEFPECCVLFITYVNSQRVLYFS